LETATDTDFQPDAGPEVFGPGDSETERAAAEYTRRREAAEAQRPELPEQEPVDDDLVKLQWQDGRPKDKPISTKEAAESYAQYREQRAKEILAQIQSDWDAYQAEQGIEPKQTFPEQQAEQPQDYKTDEQRWQEYVEALPPEGKLQVQAAQEYSQRSRHSS
jgi:hypothetical protein